MLPITSAEFTNLLSKVIRSTNKCLVYFMLLLGLLTVFTAASPLLAFTFSLCTLPLFYE